MHFSMSTHHRNLSTFKRFSHDKSHMSLRCNDYRVSSFLFNDLLWVSLYKLHFSCNKSTTTLTIFILLVAPSKSYKLKLNQPCYYLKVDNVEIHTWILKSVQAVFWNVNMANYQHFIRNKLKRIGERYKGSVREHPASWQVGFHRCRTSPQIPLMCVH